MKLEGFDKTISNNISASLGFWCLLDSHKVSRFNLQHTLIDPQKLETNDFNERKN